jgi:hypothetical protein
MTTSNCVRAILLLWALPSPGQHVSVIPDLAIAEAEYRDANEASLHNDPNLERELFNADPEQVRRRIRRAASLRDDAMLKKDVYLKAEIQRLQSLRNGMKLEEKGAIPTESERKSLEDQQARTLAEQGAVEKQLSDLPEDGESLPRRRALDQERIHLINLLSGIAQHIQSLDRIDNAQQAIEDASGGESLTQRMDEIVKLWEQERESASRQRAHWAQLYTAMEQAVNAKGPVPGTPRKGSKRKPSPPVAPQPGSPPSALRGRFPLPLRYGGPPGMAISLMAADGKWT